MAVSVQLFDVSDPINKINKSLNNGITVSADVTESFSVSNPVLILDANQAGQYITKNYAYIPEFGRYYFVDPPIYERGFVLLKLSVDVLYTYRYDIMNADIIAKRSTSKFNPYIIDGVVRTTNASRRFISRFPGEFDATESGRHYVLRIGGA